MARKFKPLSLEFTTSELLAQDRHTDWALAQEDGRLRNGRAYLAHRVHGVNKTKKGRSRRACRGKVQAD